jgi:hypothetical protein
MSDHRECIAVSIFCDDSAVIHRECFRAFFAVFALCACGCAADDCEAVPPRLFACTVSLFFQNQPRMCKKKR